MKFRKAINIYEGDRLQRLEDGRLKLQVGQWIRCGQGPCSRWCGVTNSGTLVAAHPQGKEGVTNEHFQNHLNYWKGRKRA